MSTDIKKTRVQVSTDDELIEECKKETQCNDCERITWTNPSKGDEINPPANTAAIIVDLVRHRGAIRIFKKESDDYISGVGLEDAGNFVIIPWESKWWLRPSGSVRIGYVTGKTAV